MEDAFCSNYSSQSFAPWFLHFFHNISLLCSLNVGKYTYYIAVICGTIFIKLGTDVMPLEDVRTP
jgi:hypothetical protein